MIFKLIDGRLDYDGTQLKSLFAYLNFGLLGDSMVAFEGACNIPFENMVDGEDQREKSEIRGAHMLHFIIEEFGKNLEVAVCHQRLLASIVFQELSERNLGLSLKRDGDDIFVKDGKLSISIATVSPVSALIHFAVNIKNEGTPVKTSSLNDLKIDPTEFAHRISKRFLHELQTIKEACAKVHWVR